MERIVSGVGVLDKSMAVLDALAAAGAEGLALGEVVARTAIPKPTAHRLLIAVEAHGLVRRRADGRWVLGGRLVELGRRASAAWPVAEVARPVLERLRDDSGESVQLYVRDGDERVCLVSLESRHELRTIVAEGARLPLAAGSAGRLLRGEPVDGSWVASVEERAPGVASVSAPVLVGGAVVAAVGISGPVERLGRHPGDDHGPAVTAAAERIGTAL
mgnify:CR=1 FL=1